MLDGRVGLEVGKNHETRVLSKRAQAFVQQLRRSARADDASRTLRAAKWRGCVRRQNWVVVRRAITEAIVHAQRSRQMAFGPRCERQMGLLQDRDAKWCAQPGTQAPRPYLTAGFMSKPCQETWRAERVPKAGIDGGARHMASGPAADGNRRCYTYEQVQRWSSA